MNNLMVQLINPFSQMFSYTFVVRAIIVGLLMDLCASLLGVSLVLKRYSMIGDGLSHVGFGALAIATAMNWAELRVSIQVVVAIGVIAISVTTGMNTDVCNYMFGSILSLSKADVRLSIGLSIVVLVLFVLFYSKVFAVTFDENFSRAVGTRAGAYNMLLAVLTAITIVLGMRMMGAMLISAPIIFPALTSMRLCKRFKTVMLCSAAVSLVCFFIGVALSYWYSLPTGASVVAVNIVAFLCFSAAGLVRGGIQAS